MHDSMLEIKDSNYECPSIILVHICRVVELVDFIPGSRRAGCMGDRIQHRLWKESSEVIIGL